MGCTLNTTTFVDYIFFHKVKLFLRHQEQTLLLTPFIKDEDVKGCKGTWACRLGLGLGARKGAPQKGDTISERPQIYITFNSLPIILASWFL